MEDALKEFRLDFPVGDPVFTAGDTVKGTLFINLKEPYEMINMKLMFIGEADCIWRHEDRNLSEKTSKKEKIVELEKVIFGKEKDARMTELPEHPQGRYRYDFEFLLPKLLPSSFESPEDQDLGYISYYVTAIIHRYWKFDKEIKSKVIINEIPKTQPSEVFYHPVAYTEGTLSRICTSPCKPSGTLSLKGSLNKAYFTQGENILLSALARNDSSRIMDSLYAKLIKHTRYRKNQYTKLYSDDITSYFGGCINAYSYVRWDEIPLLIPMTGPSISGSKRVVVEYLVRVGLYATFGKEIHIDLPIQIGLGPQGSQAKELKRKESAVIKEKDSVGNLQRQPELSNKEKTAAEENMKRAAERFKDLPMVGRRPAVQYLNAEERKKRREEQRVRKLSESTGGLSESSSNKNQADPMDKKTSKSLEGLNKSEKYYGPTGPKQDVNSVKDELKQRQLGDKGKEESSLASNASSSDRKESIQDAPAGKSSNKTNGSSHSKGRKESNSVPQPQGKTDQGKPGSKDGSSSNLNNEPIKIEESPALFSSLGSLKEGTPHEEVKEQGKSPTGGIEDNSHATSYGSQSRKSIGSESKSKDGNKVPSQEGSQRKAVKKTPTQGKAVSGSGLKKDDKKDDKRDDKKDNQKDDRKGDKRGSTTQSKTQTPQQRVSRSGTPTENKNIQGIKSPTNQRSNDSSQGGNKMLSKSTSNLSDRGREKETNVKSSQKPSGSYNKKGIEEKEKGIEGKEKGIEGKEKGIEEKGKDKKSVDTESDKPLRLPKPPEAWRSLAYKTRQNLPQSETPSSKDSEFWRNLIAQQRELGKEKIIEADKDQNKHSTSESRQQLGKTKPILKNAGESNKEDLDNISDLEFERDEELMRQESAREEKENKKPPSPDGEFGESEQPSSLSMIREEESGPVARKSSHVSALGDDGAEERLRRRSIMRSADSLNKGSFENLSWKGSTDSIASRRSSHVSIDESESNEKTTERSADGNKDTTYVRSRRKSSVRRVSIVSSTKSEY